ncbi:MAG: hypothetical protein EB059_08175 [Alphaproteobacteria bacterium]|nr:hypothetical protein [Alphaproteobacteria bacterium]
MNTKAVTDAPKVAIAPPSQSDLRLAAKMLHEAGIYWRYHKTFTAWHGTENHPPRILCKNLEALMLAKAFVHLGCHVLVHIDLLSHKKEVLPTRISRGAVSFFRDMEEIRTHPAHIMLGTRPDQRNSVVAFSKGGPWFIPIDDRGLFCEHVPTPAKIHKTYPSPLPAEPKIQRDFKMAALRTTIWNQYAWPVLRRVCNLGLRVIGQKLLPHFQPI